MEEDMEEEEKEEEKVGGRLLTGSCGGDRTELDQKG